MNIYEYVSEEREKLASFKHWWISSQKTVPQHFPEEMTKGEWAEQIDFFDESNESDEL